MNGGGKLIEATVISRRKGISRRSLKEVYEYRDLLYFMVLREITVLYNQTVLGVSWAILNPLISTVVFSIVFGRLAQMPSDGVPYPLFAFAGVLPWTYFSASVAGSSQSLIASIGVIGKVYFPRLFIPIVPLLAKLLDFSVAFVVFLGLLLWYETRLTAAILLVPLLLIVLMISAAGAGLLLSALALRYRDVRHASPFILQVLLYLTPIAWPLSLVPEQWRFWFALYPMVGVVEGFRTAVLGTGVFPWQLLLASALGAVAMLGIGYAYFSVAEKDFADVA
jgi:lipopolysaccharide transport system permease protein